MADVVCECLYRGHIGQCVVIIYHIGLSGRNGVWEFDSPKATDALKPPDSMVRIIIKGGP